MTSDPEPAFWDTSALIPLCVQQNGSGAVQQIFAAHPVVAWWAAPVEMASGLARLVRMRLLTSAENRQARQRVEELRKTWREIQPREQVRNLAESLLDRFPLRAADSLQLAAALTWCHQRPRYHAFISGDKQLLTAAEALEFQVIKIGKPWTIGGKN